MMDAKPSNGYEQFSWQVFLDSLYKAQAQKNREQIERELWELYPVETEKIQ